MGDVFLKDLRYALRALRSSPGFAVVAILSLGLGIGANTAIFSLIDAVLLRSLPVSNPEELFQVTQGPANRTFTNPIWEEVRDRQEAFSGVFAYGSGRFNLSPSGEQRNVRGIYASGDYFSTLGVRPIMGRLFTPADDRRGCDATAVLSYDFWQTEYAGAKSVLERALVIDGHPFQILGVAQPGFSGVEVGRGIDVIVPVCTEPIIRGKSKSDLDKRDSQWLAVIGRPKPGIAAEQVVAHLKTIAPEVYAATVPASFGGDDQVAYRRRTLDAIPAATGQSGLRNQYRVALVTLMVVVGVVLLIACANVANLLVARAEGRRREIAIRMALGSGRGRLIRQLFTESLLLSTAGAVLGVLFAQWGSRLLVRAISTTGNTVFLDLDMNWRVLAFTGAAAIATGILFGLAPALWGTRVEPQAAMKENSRGVEGRSRFSAGKALVLVQVGLSLVLVTGAGLLLGTFRKLASIDPGFQPEHVLLIRTTLRDTDYPRAQRRQLYEEMTERLRSLPGVLSASYSDNTPVSGSSWNGPVAVAGFAAKSRMDANVYFNQVSPGYFETFGTPILAGRNFDRRDTPSSPPVALVNDAFGRKFFGGASPIGKVFRHRHSAGDGPPVEIIGVVRDAKYRNLREDPPPSAYYAASQEQQATDVSTNFAVRAAGTGVDLIAAVRAELGRPGPAISMSFRPLATQLADSLTREGMLATLSGFFGGLGLLLATIGLYGVMSYNIARRRGEIGIRMALGADARRVLAMVLREVVMLVAAGLAIGVAGALASTRILDSQNFLFGMTARDPWTFAVSAAVLAGVALVAGFLPARRAARLDPLTALREE